jgi:hypothetical protein
MRRPKRTTGNNFVGEGSGEAEERTGFGHAEHPPVVGQLVGGGGGLGVSVACMTAWCF